ncbi:MAG TPA: N-acetylglucosamine/diacetylchitobiose ABC transporter substrate-binding protein [Candidatus Stackebrandtia faecavium]|nr:N-acetylglucosamine/diacetylchitobiose ABC transporter substrate-binding protein [Candidatus Stackebrandtia faecavium]
MTTNSDPRDITRRRVLQGTALGAAAIPGAAFLSSCATSGTGDDGAEVSNSGDAENPFGVDPETPIEVVIFDGGFGSKYADDKQGHLSLYAEKFPDAETTLRSETDISATMQPRFTDQEPPDLLDDSGDKKIAIDTLVNDGLLAELTPLLEAPSIDDPDKTVQDTLVEGVLKPGIYNGKVYALNYAMGGWAIWYDGKLFDDRGWKAPESWDEMMDLCAEIKKEGIAPWTYAGKHPAYLWDSLFTLAARHGGRQVSADIDNLEPKAWEHESIKLAAEALYSLQDKGYILKGTPGINHTDSQTKWNHGDAAFLPCGSWLANEQGDEAPEGFVYKAIGIPPLEGSKQPKLVWSSGEEPFVVPSDAKNKEGAFELLRIMLSEKGSQVFANLAQSPTVLDGLELKNEPAKALASLVTDAENAYRPQIVDWYSDFKENVEPVLGELMAGETKPDKFIKFAQKHADAVAKNDDIEKFEQKY